MMNLDAIAALRPFVRDGRLVQMPRRHSTRLVLLDQLAQQFDLGRHYSEIEVNEVLRAVHADYPALRRYLVDDGFLDRDSGEYWRSGGSIDLDARGTRIDDDFDVADTT